MYCPQLPVHTRLRGAVATFLRALGPPSQRGTAPLYWVGVLRAPQEGRYALGAPSPPVACAANCGSSPWTAKPARRPLWHRSGTTPGHGRVRGHHPRAGGCGGQEQVDRGRRRGVPCSGPSAPLAA